MLRSLTIPLALLIGLLETSSLAFAQFHRMELSETSFFWDARPGVRIGLDGRLVPTESAGTSIQPLSGSSLVSIGAESDGKWNELGSPGRLSARMVLDTVHDRLVLFGGTPAFDGRDYRYSNDTWVLDLQSPTAWKRLEMEGPVPEPRAGHCAAYDPIRNRLIVFGGFRAIHEGENYEFRYLGDTWALSLDDKPHWTLLAPNDSAMGRRTGTAMAYDAGHDRLLAYGGFFINLANPGDYYGIHFSDLHTLELSSTSAVWTKLAVSGGPGPRAFHSLLRDEAGKRVLLFGGRFSNKVNPIDGTAMDLWVLPDDIMSGWRRLDPANARPLLRNGQSVEWDANRGQLVMFGGFPLDGRNNYLTNETWQFDINGSRMWSRLAEGGHAPLPRQDLPMIFDKHRDRLLIVGGWGQAGCGLADTWQLTRSTNSWAELFPPGSAIAFRSNPAFGFDAANRELILYGGDLLSGGGFGPHVPDGVQAYDVDRMSWRRIATEGETPGSRSRPASTFDPIHRRLWLFGGTESGRTLDDSWALELAGTPHWRTLPAGSLRPSPRNGAVAVYDPVGDQVLLYGGASGVAGNEVWSLHDDTWAPLSVGGPSIPNRTNALGVYDSKRHRMLILGGEPDDGVIWALALDGNPTWQAIQTAGTSPLNRAGARAVYDPERDRILVFGGRNPGQFLADAFDVAELSLEGEPRWRHLAPVGAPSPARMDHALVYDEARHRLLVTGGWEGFFLWHGETFELSFAPPTLSISIEVRNSIPGNPRGPVDVALLSSPQFIPAHVDRASLRLNDAPILRALPSRGHMDLNDDGVDDLVVWFDGALMASYEHHGVLTLRGSLVDGREIEGTVTVAVRPNPNRIHADAASLVSRELGLRAHSSRVGGLVHFVMDFPQAGAWTLELFDVRGRRVGGSTGTAHGGETRTMDLPAGGAPGIYFARLIQGEATVRSQFVTL